MPTTGIAGHPLNGTSSDAPQAMEGYGESGRYRFGVLIKLDNSTAVVWRQDLHYTSGGIPRPDLPGAYSTYEVPIGSAEWVALGGANGKMLLGQANGQDDHYSFAIGVDYQNRLHICGNGHTDPEHYIRSQSLTGGVWPPNFSTLPTYFKGAWGANRHTYNYFNRLSDGTLIWMTAQERAATGTTGRAITGFYLRNGAGTTWTKIIDNSSASGALFFQSDIYNGYANRVYLTGLTVTPADHVLGWPERVHVTGIWRYGDKDANTQNSPFYLWCNASNFGSSGTGSTNWKTITGTTQPMPIKWGPTAGIGDNRVASSKITSAPQISRTFAFGIAIDGNGAPWCVYQNGGVLQGPDANPPDAGPKGTVIGNYPAEQSRLLLFWNGTNWLYRSMLAQAFGNCSGPPPVHHHGRVMLVSANGVPNRVRLWDNDAGTVVGTTRYFLGADAADGIETNVEPIAQQRGIISVMVPDGDEPRMFDFGHQAPIGVPP